MSVVITGRVVVATNAGLLDAVPSRYVYLRPSRSDFQFSLDSGTTWQNWQGDPDLAGGEFAGCIRALCNGTGDWSFTVPWTDDPAETQLPGGAPIPDLLWNVIDPNPAPGQIVYYGATPSAVVGAAMAIMELTTLPAPDTWQVGSVAYSAVPVGSRRFVTASFTSASQTASLVFADMGTTAWKFNCGIESDDVSATFYTPQVDTASKTSTSGTIRISDVPPAGKTVLVHVEIYV